MVVLREEVQEKRYSVGISREGSITCGAGYIGADTRLVLGTAEKLEGCFKVSRKGARSSFWAESRRRLHGQIVGLSVFLLALVQYGFSADDTGFGTTGDSR